MNLTWHIVKKDLRCFRGPLTCWVLLIAAKLGIGFLLLNTSAAAHPGRFGQLSEWAFVLSAVEFANCLLVGAWIQADSLLGTDAFWMTRPISGGRLLAAKFLGLIAVFLVLPVVLCIPWWLACRLSPAEISQAALMTAAGNSVGILAGTACAALAETTRGFLLSVFGLAVLVLFLVGDRYQLNEFDAALLALLAVVGVIATVAHQYFTRRTTRTLLLAAGFAAIGASYSYFAEREKTLRIFISDWDDWPVLSAPVARLRLQSQSLAPSQSPRPLVTIRTRWSLEGASPRQAIIPLKSHFHWAWPDGRSVSANGSALVSEAMASAALRNRSAPNATATFDETCEVFPDEARELLRAASTLTTSGDFALARLEAVEPLRLEAEWRLEGAGRSRILALERSATALEARSIMVGTVWQSTQAVQLVGTEYFVTGSNGQVHLPTLNRAQSAEIAGIRLSLRWIAFEPVGMPLPPNAEMLRVTFRREGRFSAGATVPFAFPPQ